MIKSTVNQFANSLGLNKDEYIPEGKASFSLFKIEILSGLTVAIALVPEAIAFAFVAGVAPLSGLYAAFIVGLVTAIFGGRPGMISGATGALAVVMVSLVSEHGVQYLFATVILMGILQFLAGIFKLGKFMRMVPQPVMLGFVNGLAIVIGLSQLHQLRGRVGRGSKESYCILMFKSSLSENAKKRINILKSSDDGFIISEEDMKLRGYGDLLGFKQSGIKNFRLADPILNKDLFLLAESEVKKLEMSNWVTYSKKSGVKLQPSEENNKFLADNFNVKEVINLANFLDVIENRKKKI